MKWSWLLPVLAVLGWGVWIFNRLVRQRNRLKEAWSGIDVQLRRRHDLIPSLVATVSGYRAHERSVFEEVTARRIAAQAVHDPASASGAEQSVTAGLRQLFAVAENYPQLKADQNFRKLSDQLVEIEDQLQYARRYYNGAARDLNNLVESLPTNVVAKIAGFQPAAFFECESSIERAAPAVSL